MPWTGELVEWEASGWRLGLERGLRLESGVMERPLAEEWGEREAFDWRGR